MKLKIVVILSCLCIYLSQAVDNDVDENISFRGLLNLVKNPEQVERAERAFTKRYAQARFTFTGPFIDDLNQAISDVPRFFVNINNFGVIEEVLTNFGHLIERISINFEKINAEEGRQIIKLINDHSTEALRYITLSSCKATVLSDLKNVFDKVYTVVFSSDSHDRLLITTENMGQSFPNVGELTIYNTLSTDWIFLQGSFTNLRSLSVMLPRIPDKNSADQTHVVNFLSMNTQLDSLNIRNGSVKLLSEISVILTDLQKLQLDELSSSNYFGEPFHFNDLTWLMMRCAHDKDIPDSVTFHRLDTLKIEFEYDPDEKFMQFISEQVNSDLRELDIQCERNTLPKEHLLVIPDKLTELRKINIVTKTTLVADDVMDFLMKNKRLTDVNMNFHMDGLEVERLKEHLLGISQSGEISNFGDSISLRLRGVQNCDPGSLDGLSLLSLTRKISFSPHCLQEAHEAFKLIYLQSHFLFTGPLVANQILSMEETRDGTVHSITNLNSIKSVHENFGPLIKRAAVDFKNVTIEEGKQIVKYIPESVEILSLLHCKGDVLKGLETEFSKVSGLWFSSQSSNDLQFNADNFNVKQFFPNVLFIVMHEAEKVDLTFINGNLPSMEALGIQNEELTVEEIENFVQQNSQIKMLDIFGAEFSKERFVNIQKTLPSLEKLNVTCTSKFVADDISDFIKGSNSLNELIVAVEMDEAEQKRLEGLIPDDWIIQNKESIQDENRTKITLKKKDGTENGSGSGSSGGSGSGNGGGTALFSATQSIQILAVTIIMAVMKLI